MNFFHKNGPLAESKSAMPMNKPLAPHKRLQKKLLKSLPFSFKLNKKTMETTATTLSPCEPKEEQILATKSNLLSASETDYQADQIIENVPSLMDVSDVSSRSRPSDESSSLASSESNPQLDSRGGSSSSSISSDDEDSVPAPCFRALRFSYLAVLLVIYLADGLQGTHLYKLYDEYGYSVASLYSLGFFTGGVMSPITGPWVDKMGRKRAAILYCVLEILINSMEQYPYLSFLIASRMIGGFTTNLLRCVFETWLDSEFRKQEQQQLDDFRMNYSGGNFAKQQKSLKSQQHHAYEILMRDSVIISNAAAIGSGYLSHILSEMSGAVGPFRGAVACTVAALVVVVGMWTENYGGAKKASIEDDDDKDSAEAESSQSILEFLQEAGRAFMADRNMLKVGIVQGLSVGSLQIFVYLWSPVLMELAKEVPVDAVASTWGLDRRGEPAFGLIFMVFMGSCVLGGLIAPILRKAATALLTPIVHDESAVVRPMAVEFLTASCYFLAACMLLVPCLSSGPDGFSQALWAFVLYEVLVGIVSPCEGVIRNLYFPSHARASVTTLPSMVVNGAVTLAVFGTQFVSLVQVCTAVVGLMLVAAYLQLSLISDTEWSTITKKVKDAPRKAHSMSLTVIKEAPKLARSLSSSFYEKAVSQPTQALRRLSSGNLDASKDKID